MSGYSFASHVTGISLSFGTVTEKALEDHLRDSLGDVFHFTFHFKFMNSDNLPKMIISMVVSSSIKTLINLPNSFTENSLANLTV